MEKKNLGRGLDEISDIFLSTSKKKEGRKPTNGFSAVTMREETCASCANMIEGSSREPKCKIFTFEHEKYFRFDKHHRTECETCHMENDYNKYTCYGCHEHSRSKVREEHVEEGIYKYEICVECHRSGDEHEAERIWRSIKRKYERGDSTIRPSENSSVEHGRYKYEHDDDHDDD